MNGQSDTVGLPYGGEMFYLVLSTTNVLSTKLAPKQQFEKI